MIIEFENASFVFLREKREKSQGNEKIFLLGVRDRNILKNEYRLVLATLSEKETKNLYESLQKYFEK